MTLSVQDLRLRRAHAEFERTVRGVPDPVRLALGALRALAAIASTVFASRREPDPIALEPRVLHR